MTLEDFNTDLTGFFDNGIDKTIFICSGMEFFDKTSKEQHSIYQLAILDKASLRTKDNLFIVFKELADGLSMYYKDTYYKVVSSDSNSFTVDRNGIEYIIQSTNIPI